jgi:hypothetical protein
MTGTLACLDITVSAGIVTFATGTTPQLEIRGSMSLVAGTIWTYNQALNFTATTTGRTITTNGTSLAGVIGFNGAGGGWTLGSALTTTGSINIVSGSFNTSSTGNYSVSCSTFQLNGTVTRSATLNASTLTLSVNNAQAFSIPSLTNLTFNAGTSQINLTGGTTTGINSGGLTFYNVSFATANASITITGNNTFNNLSFAGRSTTGISTTTISGDQTINGTLTLSGAGVASGRAFITSNTIGTQRTLTVNAFAAGASDYDFRDIAVTGTAAPLTGTRFGDCKGNSGITFPAAKTVYWRHTGGPNSWGQTGLGSWSFTIGGAFDATAFPLAQDTAVFPAATYPASGSTANINFSYNIGTIDMSARTTNTMTLGTGTTAPAIYGNWINGTGTTISGTGSLTFQGRGAQTITSAGRSFTQNIGTTSPGGSVTLLDNLTTSTGTQSGAGGGTFNANGYNFTAVGYSSNNTGVRTIAIGSGTWTLNGVGSPWNTPTITNLTVTGTGTISLTNASAKIFNGGGIQTYPTLNQGGTGTLTVTGSNKFAAITATTAGTVSLTSGTTTQVPLINTTGTATVTVNPTSTTATIRGSVRSSRANLTGPLVLGAS